MTKRYCLALDLKDDPELINEYKHFHSPGQVWPEVLKSIKDSAILHMEIHHTGNRLFMIMEVDGHFTFEKKIKMDATNEKVQDWEKLMWQFQQAMPHAKPGEKWVLMDKIFEV
ncbi:MAG: L-rhamnose mutarotase [Saprospiraceae bacterium]|nr:L-rhamnose mutarotase [Saprospiraceae bacterium]